MPIDAKLKYSAFVKSFQDALKSAAQKQTEARTWRSWWPPKQ